METKEKLLEINDLHVSFFTPGGEVKAVNGISYDLMNGEILGIVGESGAGKSVQAYSIMGLLQPPGKIVKGSIKFMGQDVLAFSKKEQRSFRGKEVSMIFQNPMTCLNPVYTIGDQLAEALIVHGEAKRREAMDRVAEILHLVGINDVEERMRQYPHELSGGMRQRAMIAMGLICNPKILIADEPTTALDVTIQAQILELMKEIQRKTGMAIIFVTHNLGVVAEICDRVCVMYGGHIVEKAEVRHLFYKPAHPYTKGLLRSLPRVDAREYERLIPIGGTPVDMLYSPAGCPFAPRCEECRRICCYKMPDKTEVEPMHESACWLLSREGLSDKDMEKVNYYEEVPQDE